MNEGGRVVNKEWVLEGFYEEMEGGDERGFEKGGGWLMKLWDYE